MPDFDGNVGGIVDARFISEQVRLELLLHLDKSALTLKQKSALIDFANDMAQTVMDGKITPAKSQRKQIENVANDARRLLSSLKKMSTPASNSFQSHADFLAFGTDPPVKLASTIKATIKQPGGSLLAAGWDYVDALRKTAEYAAQKYEIGKTSKLEQLRARDFVSLLAEHVRAITNETPPKDKASWFACFSMCLGEHLKLPIGPRIVASGIAAMR